MIKMALQGKQHANLSKAILSSALLMITLNNKNLDEVFC
jgi:hypothetical protein